MLHTRTDLPKHASQPQPLICAGDLQHQVKYVCSIAGRGATCAVCGRPAEAPALYQARRRVLLGAAALVALPACEARAAWDGSSAAIGSCPLGDDGDECRRQTLMCGPQHCTAVQVLTKAYCRTLPGLVTV